MPWDRITSRFTSEGEQFLTKSFSDDPSAASQLLIKQLVEAMRDDLQFEKDLKADPGFGEKAPGGGGDVVQIFNSGNFVNALMPTSSTGSSPSGA